MAAVPLFAIAVLDFRSIGAVAVVPIALWIVVVAGSVVVVVVVLAVADESYFNFRTAPKAVRYRPFVESALISSTPLSIVLLLAKLSPAEAATAELFASLAFFWAVLAAATDFAGLFLAVVVWAIIGLLNFVVVVAEAVACCCCLRCCRSSCGLMLSSSSDFLVVPSFVRVFSPSTDTSSSSCIIDVDKSRKYSRIATEVAVSPVWMRSGAFLSLRVTGKLLQPYVSVR
jgi:hypothetical protein